MEPVTCSGAGQHTLGQHEHARPLGEVVRGAHHSPEAGAESVGPTVSGTFGDMMKSGHVGLQDGREGRGNRGRACHWRGR